MAHNRDFTLPNHSERTLSPAALACRSALEAFDASHAAADADAFARMLKAAPRDLTTGDALWMFASAQRPNLSLTEYAERFRYFAGADSHEVAHAIGLALRAARDTPEKITPLVAHRLVGTAFIVTLKLTRDILPLAHRDLCTVAGVHVTEYVRLERVMLCAADYRGMVSDEAALAACAAIAARHAESDACPELPTDAAVLSSGSFASAPAPASDSSAYGCCCSSASSSASSERA